MPVGDSFLQTPLHDTGSIWYAILSFLLPLLGLIGGFVFRHFKHYKNAKACFKGALICLGVLAVVIAFFALMLLLATL